MWHTVKMIMMYVNGTLVIAIFIVYILVKGEMSLLLNKSEFIKEEFVKFIWV